LTSITSVYEALGQLAYHSDEGALRVAVLPSDVSPSKRARIETLGVRLLTYSWSGGEVHFDALNELLRNLQAR
jgi:hypothetical protein